MTEFLKPLNTVIGKATTLIEGRRSEFFNHEKAIAESISALTWIAYTRKECGMSLPIAHVEESWQMAEFYNNKVLVEYKSKDPNHVEWAKAMKELYIPSLRDYVRFQYPFGPLWSTSGKNVHPSGQRPPPSSRPSSSFEPRMCAIFDEINSGNVTSGLRKVTADMKAKNRNDRSGMVPTNDKGSHVSSKALPTLGPPKLELQMGRKWVVENQIGIKDLVINECDAKQSIYVYGCKDSVLKVEGKVNNITMDKCVKMGLVFQDIVAAFGIVNCNNVEMQSQGSTPSISVDNTSGCQMYLSNESLGAYITTAKSSEINVLVLGDEGDWVEYSLPQQYAHEYKKGQFVTIPFSHSGA